MVVGNSTHTPVVELAGSNTDGCELCGCEYLEAPEEFYLTTVIFIAPIIVLREYFNWSPCWEDL